MRVFLSSENETYKLGMKIADTLRGGEMILLTGEMGAGKTVLTKGIASGLGVTAEISSPTFTLLNTYRGKAYTLHHYDLFRLTSIEEAEEAGLTEFFGDKESVCVIEWPDKLLPILEGFNIINIKMEYIDDDTRKATVLSGSDTGEATVLSGSDTGEATVISDSVGKNITEENVI